MATSNEKIRDELIQRQVDLLGLARGMARRLVAILTRGERQLRAELRARMARAAAIGRDTGPERTRRLQQIERQIQVLLAPQWSEVGRAIRADLNSLVIAQSEFLRGLVVSSLPVVVDFVLPPRERLREIVTHSPIDGRPLAQLLAGAQAADRARIMAEVRTGLLFAETPVQISRRVFGTQRANGTDGARQTTRRGIQTLANTAVAAISSQADAAFARENADLIARELYVATLDSRTTPICRSVDGDEYPIGEGPVPPLHPNCRSRRVPVIDGRSLGNRPAVEATERQLAGLRGAERRARVRDLVGQVPARTTYQQWLEGRPAAFQDEVLGRTKGRLFRRGELPLKRFVDPTGREYTIEQLREREPAAFQRAGL